MSRAESEAVHDTPEVRRLCREHGARVSIAKDALKDGVPTVVLGLFGNGE